MMIGTCWTREPDGSWRRTMFDNRYLLRVIPLDGMGCPAWRWTVSWKLPSGHLWTRQSTGPCVTPGGAKIGGSVACQHIEMQRREATASLEV